MKLLLTSIFFLSLISSTFANENIVGGSSVDPQNLETSHIVYFDGGCAGSVIAAKWILTAAHCNEIIKQYVTAGEINLRSKERFKLYIKQSYVHPDYNNKTFSNDFALVELKYPIHFENMGIKKINLLTPELVELGAIDPGVVGIAMGWGSVQENGKYSKSLLYVELPIISHETANSPDAYNGLIDETMIAAGLESGQKDTCQGDSGGPFTVAGIDGKPILAGIISWGAGCGRIKQYGIYSNVAVGYPWIIKMINE